jgi:hypothetical protein
LLAVYGADDLTQTNTVYLDTSFGMGYNLRELAQVRKLMFVVTSMLQGPLQTQ